MPKIDELELDLAELRTLEAGAQRSRVRQILSTEVRKLETELVQEKKRAATTPGAEGAQAAPQHPRNTLFTTKITDYAWDQSEKFVKLYVTLPGVHELPAENVKSTFGPRRMELEVSALAGRNHQLLITNLMNEIQPDSSYHKVKTDMVVLFLRKTSTSNWSHVTELEKKAKEPKLPRTDVDTGDPGSSLMNMMKQMYDEGDDDMKRTIAKAWTEAREKQQTNGEDL